MENGEDIVLRFRWSPLWSLADSRWFFAPPPPPVPPSIRPGEVELSTVENSQVLLSCIADGVPQPIISWEKEGTPLTDTTGESTILPSGELVIDTAQVGQLTVPLRLCLPSIAVIVICMCLDYGSWLVLVYSCFSDTVYNLNVIELN